MFEKDRTKKIDNREKFGKFDVIKIIFKRRDLNTKKKEKKP